MYPLDRRQLALHIYPLINSLRKVGFLLQVSHTTISRWLVNPFKKQYERNVVPKSKIIVESLKACLQVDPFISLQKLQGKVYDLFGFKVSKELLRIVIKKEGFTKKKARFFSKPNNLEEKTKAFLLLRDYYKNQNRLFVSLDETSFGRNTKSA